MLFQSNSKSKSKWTLLLGLLVLVVEVAVSEKILFYFALSPYSHRITVWPLVNKLVGKGHEVTFLSPFPPKQKERNEAVTEIVPSALSSLIGLGTGDNFLGDVLERRIARSYEGLWAEHRAMGLSVCEALFKPISRDGGDEQEEGDGDGGEVMRDLVRNGEFDLVIIDSLHNECGIGLAFKYEAPFILYGASSVFLWQSDIYGHFFESNWIPDITKNYELPMGFLEKVRNTLNPIYVHLMRHWFEMPEMDIILRNALGLRYMPPLEELEKNVSLILQNNHFSIEFPRALPPLYVSVAGMHCEDGVTGNHSIFPKALDDFIDECDDEGFMLISFGTAVNISLLPDNFQTMFFEVLQNFSIRFVWKWDGERPAKMPPNVYTSIWLPQQAILAHPKIKGFISQAGLLSIQEAITHAVPLIVLPIFGDQDYNAEKVQRQGYGIRLEMSRLKREGLSDAISNILNEPKYKLNMEGVSQRFKDRPMKALDSAVWWTEYVLRHKGGAGLRPLAASQNWIQLRLLDVWGFLMFLVFFFFVVILLCIRQVCIIILSDDEDEEETPDVDKDGKRRREKRAGGSGSRRGSDIEEEDEEQEEDNMGMDFLGLSDSRRNSLMGRDMYDYDMDHSGEHTPIDIPHILEFDKKKNDQLLRRVKDRDPPVPVPVPVVETNSCKTEENPEYPPATASPLPELPEAPVQNPLEKDKDI